jgi:hydroxymethylbilane synthase
VTVLRLGTRRSPLALAQAEEVKALLAATGVDSQIVPLSTSGDEAAPSMGSESLKGLWIDKILDALEAGDIDVAVHSAKDLPAEDSFPIAAVPQRADPRDVIVSRHKQIPAGATIGTSSIRRRAQLIAGDKSLRFTDLRGNVDTRLRKVEQGEVDAAVLAAAGLSRLGLQPANSTSLSIEEMVPAPGQGCLALQIRADDARTRHALLPLDHRPSHRALDAERALVRLLAGGCDLPLGAYATAALEGPVHMIAVVASADGELVLRVAIDGPDEQAVAEKAAKNLIDAGAAEILTELGKAL